MNAVSRRYESRLNKLGTDLIAGVDESGIGPLAGPVVAAAVILKDGYKLKGLDDSKKLNREKRQKLYHEILASSVSVSIGIIDSSTIDHVNILQASLLAMANAVKTLSVQPGHVLIDGIRCIPGIELPQSSIKHGDRLSSIIAAASIVAKVIRDALMDNYDLIYPQYGFKNHKGYGTEEHIRCLKKHGPSSIHRISYDPVRTALRSKGLLIGNP